MSQFISASKRKKKNEKMQKFFHLQNNEKPKKKSKKNFNSNRHKEKLQKNMLHLIKVTMIETTSFKNRIFVAIESVVQIVLVSIFHAIHFLVKFGTLSRHVIDRQFSDFNLGLTRFKS